MRRTASRCVVISSVLALGALSWAGGRPHYGGTLHLEVVALPQSVEPALAVTSAGATDVAGIDALLFETLVRFDASGGAQPLLATEWQHDAAARQWRFTIRNGVQLHDGTPLTPTLAGQSLVAANRDWRVNVEGGQLVIDLPIPDASLLEELARPGNAIVQRSAAGTLVGTGPFLLRELQPGRSMVLVANSRYWAGRPFLDEIALTSRSLNDQWLDLQLGRADAIELAPDRVRRLGEIGGVVVTSAPSQLLAVQCLPDRPAVANAHVRSALGLSLDRAAMYSALLQHEGAITGALLPDWLTGYGFLFPTGRDVTRSRSLLAQVSPPQPITIDFDPADSVGEIVAERIAVDAAQSGLSLRAVPRGTAPADVQLVRVIIPAGPPGPALAILAGQMHLGGTSAAALRGMTTLAESYEQAYNVERELVADGSVIPLFHLPESYGLSRRVQGWSEPPRGGLPLANVWLAPR